MSRVCFCVVCNKLIPNKTLQHRTKTYVPKYCSRNCYLQGHKAKFEKRLCPNCNTYFLIQKCRRKTFCSKKCRYENSQNMGHEYIGKNGYVYIKVSPKRYELKHRIVMEDKIKRRLKETEYVHHKNGRKTDNRSSNLQLFSSNSAHAKYHNSLFTTGHPKDSKESIRKRVETRKRNRERKLAGTNQL